MVRATAVIDVFKSTHETSSRSCRSASTPSGRSKRATPTHGSIARLRSAKGASGGECDVPPEMYGTPKVERAPASNGPGAAGRNRDEAVEVLEARAARRSS